jgi:hypothetical protein
MRFLPFFLSLYLNNIKDEITIYLEQENLINDQYYNIEYYKDDELYIKKLLWLDNFWICGHKNGDKYKKLKNCKNVNCKLFYKNYIKNDNNLIISLIDSPEFIKNRIINQHYNDAGIEKIWKGVWYCIHNQRIKRCKELECIISRNCVHRIKYSTCTKCQKKRLEKQEEFIKKAIIIHENKYTYNQIYWNGSEFPINIYCVKHNIYFPQIPDKHISRQQGCRKCSSEKNTLAQTRTRDEFIKKSTEIHGDKYTYELVNYIKSDGYVKVLCVFHQLYFDIMASNHLHGNNGRGSGCGICAYIQATISNTKTREEFIEEAMEIHGDKYTYELVDYKKGDQKVKIYCVTCKIYFTQTPANHINQQSGCGNCYKPKSEKLMIEIFKELYGYNFIKIRPNFLKNSETGNNLELDAYCHELKIASEYNGRQHDEYNEFFHKGDIENFTKQQERDALKIKLCEENNITLFTIPHTYNYKNPQQMKEYILEITSEHRMSLVNKIVDV